MLVIIVDVIFFSVVFVYLDNSEQAVATNPKIGNAWLLCLAEASGNKNECLHLASSLTVNEPTVMAVLILLSVSILWTLYLTICILIRIHTDQWNLASNVPGKNINVYWLVHDCQRLD